MNAWFTEEKIDEVTIAISEYGHFEETHSYLLVGSERSLLIDSGLGVSNIRSVVEKYADAGKTMVVATHAHWDHIGGHRHFENAYVNKNEKAWLADNFPLPPSHVRKNFEDRCFKNGKPSWFDVDKYELYSYNRINEISGGYIFDLGNRKISVLDAPGHSPGHMCFFENDVGYLFTGDNIYRGTIYVNYPSTDPAAYKRSIDKLFAYRSKISRLLPAHHDLNVNIDLLDEAKMLLRDLEKEDRLKHGTGRIAGRQIAILL